MMVSLSSMVYLGSTVTAIVLFLHSKYRDIASPISFANLLYILAYSESHIALEIYIQALAHVAFLKCGVIPNSKYPRANASTSDT
jgi:hypothetical protein